MPIRAVGFDIGGVLERVASWEVLSDRWAERLGVPEPVVAAALAAVDPDDLAGIGGLDEAQISRQFAAALSLSAAQTAQFMTDMWDWYCGELDVELAAFAVGLRPRYRTGILSNSADGARREEQARHGIEDMADVVIYSHEVRVAKPDARAFQLLCRELDVAPGELIFVDDQPGHIAAATGLGIHGVLHVSAAKSIAAIEGLLAPAL